MSIAALIRCLESSGPNDTARDLRGQREEVRYIAWIESRETIYRATPANLNRTGRNSPEAGRLYPYPRIGSRRGIWAENAVNTVF